jgi:hypothetical protein
MNYLLNPKFTSALTIVAGFASAIYFTTSYFYSRKKVRLSMDPDVVLRVVKDFRREFYVVFNYLATLSNQVQNRLRSFSYHSQSSNLTEQMSNKLIEKNPVFEKLVRGIQVKIYEKYGIPDNNAFDELCEELRQSDESIDFIIKDISDHFKKALIGILEHPPIQLPIFLDIESVLVTYHDLTVKSLEFLYKNHKAKSQQHSLIEDEDRRIIDRKQDSTYTGLRMAILKEKGFDCHPDVHPEQLLEIAVQKYSEENMFFKECISRYNYLNKEICEELGNGSTNTNAIQAKVMKFPIILNNFLKTQKRPGSLPEGKQPVAMSSLL